MHPAHRITAAIALVAAPLLFATGEFLRLQVEGGVDYGEGGNDFSRTLIEAVASGQDAWFLHGIAVLIGTIAWVVAVAAIIAFIGRSRPILALVGGVLGLASAVAHGAHLGFYSVTLSVLAGMPADGRDAGVSVWSATADDPLGTVLVLLFMVTFFVAPLVLAFGLWRERAMPWWAFALFVVGQLLMAGASDLVLGLGQLLWLPAMIFTGLRFGAVQRSATVDPHPVRA